MTVCFFKKMFDMLDEWSFVIQLFSYSLVMLTTICIPLNAKL